MQVGLVEDDENCALAVIAELRLAGFDCRHFPTARAALEAGQQGALPSLVLVDLGLPGEDALGLIAELHARHPSLSTVVLTGRAGGDAVFQALRAGAVGFVLKHDALGRLGEVVSEVAQGGAPMTPEIARRVVSAFQQAAATPTLTPRELDVLRHLSKGLSYAEAASALQISIDTVRSHVRKLYDRLHVANKAEAVAFAIRSGLLD